MTQSTAGIASIAAIHLGRDTIADLDASNDEFAELMRARLPSVRDKLLRSYPWNFAMKFASIPGSSLDPGMFGYTHKCIMPADCLKIWRVQQTGQWAAQEGAIYTKFNPPVSLQYIARITDPEQYDALFYELLGLELAIAVLPRAGTAEIARRRRELVQDRRALRREATLADAQEKSRDDLAPGAGSWLEARRPL